MRMDKTLAAARDYGVVSKGFITTKEKDNAIAFIFSNAYKLSMEAFFTHFANTDIVKTKDGYYIWESDIVPKPEAAGIALWLWAATLYAYDIPIAIWDKEIRSWLRVFKKYAPRTQAKGLDIKIQVNLAERLLGTLFLDLPLERSPFDRLPKTKIQKARAIFRALLNNILN